MITQSHLVPGKQIQALHFPELISGDVLQKDEMCLMQHRKAQSLSEACIKKGGNVSLTLFVVPQFLVRSLTHVFTRTHICKLAAYSVCTNSITPTKSAHTHTHPQAHARTHAHSTTLRAASECYKQTFTV